MDDREAEWALDMAMPVRCKDGVEAAFGGVILKQFKSTKGLLFYVVELVDTATRRTFFKIRTAKKLEMIE